MPRRYTIVIVLDDDNVDVNYSAEHERVMFEEGNLDISEFIELAENDKNCSVTYTVEEVVSADL